MRRLPSRSTPSSTLITKPIAGAADPAARHRHLAAAQNTSGSVPALSGSVLPTSSAQDVAQADRLLLEHCAQLDSGHPDLARQMVLPDRIAAELLAHEHLQKQVTGGLQGRVGDQELDRAAAILEVDAQAEDDAAIARPGDRGEARIGLHPLEAER